MGKREDQSNRRTKKLRRRKIAKSTCAKVGNAVSIAHKKITLDRGVGVEEKIICAGEVEELSTNEDADESLDVERNEADNSFTSNPEESENLHSSELQQTPNGKKTHANSKKAIVPIPASPQIISPNAGKKAKKRRHSGTSSDEERWLTAIESGKLDDVDDELKKMKDPKLMTARQRAMYDRSIDKETALGGELLMALPSGYREKEKPQTAEDIQKAVLKSQKRKQQADERREKDKKKTMERLLKKQDSNKLRGVAGRNKTQKPTLPMICYRNTTATGATIQMPADYEFPLRPQVPSVPPKPQMCGVKGCNQRKVYNCVKTKVPLCSLKCYRKNLQSAH